MFKRARGKVDCGVLFCVKWRYLIALIVFVLCVALKLHGSSIAEYNKLFDKSEEYNSEQIILGKSRTIRSDEWLVHTPYYMSQVYNNFDKTSDMMSVEGQDMIVGYNSPVADITVIAKPFTWGYMLLGNEYGLSWYWCSKLILMILVSFELCMIITRKNIKVSLLGMLMVTFSPLMQWWFLPHAADVFFWGMALLTCAYYFFTAKNIWYKNLFTILTPLSAITFVIALFPSLQLPVGLVIIALLITFLIRDKKEITFTKKDIWRIVLMGCAAMAVVIYTIISSKDAIMTLYNTVYPGKRVSLGDGSSIKNLFTDLTVFTLPYKNITYLNNCEVSTFIHFAPVFFMLYPWIYRKLKRDKNIMLGNVMLGCLIVMIIFMVAGFPELLAKVTFFSYINRMDLTYGFVATLFTVWGISMIWKKKIFTKWQIIWTIVAYVLLNICFIGERELTYLDWWQYGIIIAGLTILVYLMLKNHQGLFLVGMFLLIAISSFTINPLSRGTSALFKHPLEQEIKGIATEKPDERWLAVNERLLASIGVANGAKVLNMVNFYPDYGKWRIVDPDGKFDEVYNRYAHINVALGDKTEFTAGPTADVFNVILSCEDAKKLDVNFLLIAGKLEKCTNEFSEIYKDTEGNYYIYERIGDE